MLKLAVFDIDGTLAPIGKSMKKEDAEKIRLLESRGVRIGLCSGKPVYYECGFARMLGLSEPLLIGDVGGAVQIGYDLPPKRSYVLPVPEKTVKKLQTVERELKDLYGDELWFEPAKTCVTPFPRCAEGFAHVNEYIEKKPELMEGIRIYKYCDSFDFIAKEVDKGAGLDFACKLLDIRPDEVAAAGDGQNDHPMLEYAKYSFGIKLKEPSHAVYNVSSVSEALDGLLRIKENE